MIYYPHALISICIPTCNQPSELDLTLSSLNLYESNVEILIRDDSSDEKTQIIVNKYDYLPIRYWRMDKEGIDIAFLWLIEQSKGAYIWLFGDDIMQRDSIKNLGNIISSHSPDFIYVNSCDMDNNKLSILADSYHGDDKNFYINLIKDQLGFCSALIFKAKLLESCIKNSHNYIGTCWVTLFLALGVINNSKKLIFDKRVFFLSKYKPPGEKKWYDSYLVHSVYYAKVLEFYTSDYAKGVISQLIDIKYKASVKAVLSERGKGYTTGYATRGKKFFPTLVQFWDKKITYPMLIMMLLPNILLMICYKIYKNLFK